MFPNPTADIGKGWLSETALRGETSGNPTDIVMPRRSVHRLGGLLSEKTRDPFFPTYEDAQGNHLYAFADEAKLPLVGLLAVFHALLFKSVAPVLGAAMTWAASTFAEERTTVRSRCVAWASFRVARMRAFVARQAMSGTTIHVAVEQALIVRGLFRSVMHFPLKTRVAGRRGDESQARRNQPYACAVHGFSSSFYGSIVRGAHAARLSREQTMGDSKGRRLGFREPAYSGRLGVKRCTGPRLSTNLIAPTIYQQRWCAALCPPHPDRSQ